MHYIRIRQTQLAASYVKADRVAHMISVLIAHDPEAASLAGPATYYDLGDSYCTALSGVTVSTEWHASDAIVVCLYTARTG